MAGKTVGRYQVLQPLAKGGMAEVFLARTTGIRGFERHVVLKFIRVDHGVDDRTNSMLLDEARLVASLHHRNIVQVHDVGQHGTQYFFAMEYVHGADGRCLLSTVKDAGGSIPLEHALTIVTAAAAGLHYAHEHRGPDRKPLDIVHRDISPGNILLGFDGSVKVVDFGIAKTAQQESTQAGELKGKAGYMSPEQCMALPLDRRTDIYMLGIVLYELCTVRRLFKGDNPFQTMEQIVGGDIPPPSRFRKDLPDELERIILKALATDREERYQTADQLRLALEAFATRANMQISPSKLSDYLKGLYGERPEPWVVEVPPPDSTRMTTAELPVVETDVLAIDDETVSTKTRMPVEPDTPMAWAMAEHAADRRRTFLIGALSVAAIAIGTIGGVAFVMSRRANVATASPSVPAIEVPADAGIATPEIVVAPDAAVVDVAEIVIDAGIEARPTTKPVRLAPKPKPVKPALKPAKNPVKKPAKPVKASDLDSPFPTE